MSCFKIIFIGLCSLLVFYFQMFFVLLRYPTVHAIKTLAYKDKILIFYWISFPYILTLYMTSTTYKVKSSETLSYTRIQVLNSVNLILVVDIKIKNFRNRYHNKLFWLASSVRNADIPAFYNMRYALNSILHTILLSQKHWILSVLSFLLLQKLFQYSIFCLIRLFSLKSTWEAGAKNTRMLVRKKR